MNNGCTVVALFPPSLCLGELGRVSFGPGGLSWRWPVLMRVAYHKLMGEGQVRQLLVGLRVQSRARGFIRHLSELCIPNGPHGLCLFLGNTNNPHATNKIPKIELTSSFCLEALM
jgi:hypothetical protein